MKRFFSIVLGALAMVAVALISAFIAMRFAIHGREVDVPSFAGLSVAQAGRLALRDGLDLTLENRFYSTEIPAGRILAQYPAAGARVRREWPVTVTESLGPQQVSIPDLTGQPERTATVSIRRVSLELGAVAHLAAPGDPDVVLTQTPPADSGGVDGPRVSLLVSDSESASPQAYVMPSLVGLTWASAVARAATAGLHLVVAPDASQTTTPGAPQAASPPGPAALLPQAQSQPAAPAHPSGIVAAQTPQPGRRVQRGDAVHVVLGHPEQQAVIVVAPQ